MGNIPLEIIVYYYREGASVEEILERLPTLKEADLHGVHYLNHQDLVDAYVLEQERLGDELRAKIEAEFPSDKALLDRLRARLMEKRKARVSSQ